MRVAKGLRDGKPVMIAVGMEDREVRRWSSREWTELKN
jgi:hypothetical protein